MNIRNKKAYYDYVIVDTLEAGIQLKGPEVKSIKGGNIKLEGSYVRIIGSEVYLVNAHIYPYIHARIEGYDPKRTRKLLLHKKQIISLKSKITSTNLTLVPTKIYTMGPLIKVEIGLARGKKSYDKRESKKKKDIEREVEREYKKTVV